MTQIDLNKILVFELKLIKALARASFETDSIGGIVAGGFPRVCKLCSARYETLVDFVNNTTIPVGGRCVEFYDHVKKWAIFRNCACDTTLAVSLNTQREKSDYGILRRELFELCVEKVRLGCDPSVTDEEIRQQLRLLFRTTLTDTISDTFSE